MEYRKCGNSGLYLPVISLGLWHNFGSVDPFDEAKKMLCRAFERGVTHFDIANNYGPDPGSAEITFGRVLEKELASHRDEIIVTTKAGHLMWNGPYGDGSSRKYLTASLNQSLKRMRLDYVDIFYTHRYSSETPLEETLQTLVDIVRSGKALYIGISKYPPLEAEFAYQYLKKRDVPCLVHQARYNMFDRAIEGETLALAHSFGVGMIAFSPLAQGILTDRYLNGIPQESRAAKSSGFLQSSEVTDTKIKTVKQIAAIASQCGMSIAEFALSWILRHPAMTSVVIGSSSVQQLEKNIHPNNYSFLSDEIVDKIEQILSQE